MVARVRAPHEKLDPATRTAARGARPTLGWWQLLLAARNRFLQFNPGRELGHATRGNLDQRTGLRVAAIARLALRDVEGSESDDGDPLAFLQRGGDAVHHGLDGGGGMGL